MADLKDADRHLGDVAQYRGIRVSPFLSVLGVKTL